MRFAPKPTPKGYSYFEDATRQFQQELNKNKPPSYDIPIKALIDECLKSKYAQHATAVVQKVVGAVYMTPTGKFLINKVASTSLGKSVQGAAAISHVSKIVRSHGISNFGMMVYNDGKLLFRYYNGDINGSELGNELLMETTGQGGDMVGWMVGASIAGSLLCPPYGATVIALVGSMVGRMVVQSIARRVTNS